MQKKCVCGNNIRITAQLCSECREIYGLDSEEWPLWLKEWLTAYQKEWNHEKNHHNLTLYEETMIEKARSTTYPNDPYGQYEKEYDEWGNEVALIDGSRYVDTDKQHKAEKSHEAYLKYLSELSPKAKAKLRKQWGMN